jgi:hypothetical protein
VKKFYILIILISFNTLKADVTYTEEEKDDAIKVLAVGVGLVVYAAITQSKNKQAGYSSYNMYDHTDFMDGIVLHENSLQKIRLFPIGTPKLSENFSLNNNQTLSLTKNINSIDIIRLDFKIFEY